MSYSAATFTAAKVLLLAVAAGVFPLGAAGPKGAECCPESSSITGVAAAAS